MHPDVSELFEAMARPGQPEPLFHSLDALIARTVGHRLITLLQLTADGTQLQRVYTSDPAAYPLQGRKPVPQTRWTELVLRKCQPYLGSTLSELREMIGDHQLIARLGLGSIINVPVVYDGAVLGALNILHADGYYSQNSLEKARVYSGFLIPAFLNEEART
jgi:GAF domain-containing protein